MRGKAREAKQLKEAQDGEMVKMGPPIPSQQTSPKSSRKLSRAGRGELSIA